MESYLFNISEIERKNNSPLILEFYGGDITSIYSDVLLVSAFQSSYIPTYGSVFWSIKEKFGIELGNQVPQKSQLILEGLHEFPVPKTSAFSRLWVKDIKQFSNDSSSNIDIIRAFHFLENLADAFDKFAIKSISLPLLGTGNQGISLEDSAINIMRIVKTWSVQSKTLETVRIFAYDLKAASILNNIIDSYFGIPSEQYSDSVRELFHTVTKELKDKIKEDLEELYNIANNKVPSIKSIAVAGRRLAEECSVRISKKWYANSSHNDMPLHLLISKIQDRLKKKKPWILSYLRLLQSCGNTGAHRGKQVLNMVDACAVLIATIRVAEFTITIENS